MILSKVRKCNYVRLTKLHLLELLYQPVAFSCKIKTSNLVTIINAHSLNFKKTLQ